MDEVRRALLLDLKYVFIGKTKIDESESSAQDYHWSLIAAVDSKLFVVSVDRGVLFLSNESLCRNTDDIYNPANCRLIELMDRPTHICVSRNSKWIALGFYDRFSINSMLDFVENSSEGRSHPTREDVTCLKWSTTDRLLVISEYNAALVGSPNGTVKKVGSKKDFFICGDWSPEGNRIALGCDDGRVVIYQYMDGADSESFIIHEFQSAPAECGFKKNLSKCNNLFWLDRENIYVTYSSGTTCIGVFFNVLDENPVLEPFAMDDGLCFSGIDDESDNRLLLCKLPSWKKVLLIGSNSECTSTLRFEQGVWIVCEFQRGCALKIRSDDSETGFPRGLFVFSHMISTKSSKPTPLINVLTNQGYLHTYALIDVSEVKVPIAMGSIVRVDKSSPMFEYDFIDFLDYVGNLDSASEDGKESSTKKILYEQEARGYETEEKKISYSVFDARADALNTMHQVNAAHQLYFDLLKEKCRLKEEFARKSKVGLSWELVKDSHKQPEMYKESIESTFEGLTQLEPLLKNACFDVNRTRLIFEQKHAETKGLHWAAYAFENLVHLESKLEMADILLDSMISVPKKFMCCNVGCKTFLTTVEKTKIETCRGCEILRYCSWSCKHKHWHNGHAEVCESPIRSYRSYDGNKEIRMKECTIDLSNLLYTLSPSNNIIAKGNIRPDSLGQKKQIEAYFEGLERSTDFIRKGNFIGAANICTSLIEKLLSAYPIENLSVEHREILIVMVASRVDCHLCMLRSKPSVQLLNLVLGDCDLALRSAIFKPSDFIDGQRKTFEAIELEAKNMQFSLGTVEQPHKSAFFFESLKSTEKGSSNPLLSSNFDIPVGIFDKSNVTSLTSNSQSMQSHSNFSHSFGFSGKSEEKDGGANRIRVSMRRERELRVRRKVTPSSRKVSGSPSKSNTGLLLNVQSEPRRIAQLSYAGRSKLPRNDFTKQPESSEIAVLRNATCEQRVAPLVLLHPCSELLKANYAQNCKMPTDTCPICGIRWNEFIGPYCYAVVLQCRHAVCASCIGRLKLLERINRVQVDHTWKPFCCTICHFPMQKGIAEFVASTILEVEEVKYITDSLGFLLKYLAEGKHYRALLSALLVHMGLQVFKLQDVLFSTVGLIYRNPYLPDREAASRQRSFQQLRTKVKFCENEWDSLHARTFMSVCASKESVTLCNQYEDVCNKLLQARIEAAKDIMDRIEAGHTQPSDKHVGVRTSHIDLRGVPIEDVQKFIRKFVFPVIPIVNFLVLIAGSELAIMNSTIKETLTSLGLQFRNVPQSQGTFVVMSNPA